MKKLFYSVLAVMLFTASYAQDIVYATDLDNGRIRKITANPSTGATSGNFTTVKDDLTPSAALGASNNGWLYYLQYGDGATGSGDGKVDIWAVKADGTGNATKICNNFDINGNSDAEVEFVRLGITNQNVAWIVSKSSDGNTIYLAKFTVSGNSSVTPTRCGTANTSDGNNSIFNNGDLAFDGLGNMYALANDGSGNTKIYTISGSVLSSLTTSSVTTLQYKWLLKKSDGSNFTGRVNGNAFSSNGSMYVSTDDGLYFINQSTVNSVGTGTVQCVKVKDQSGLTDLATAYWPAQTTLPVKFTSFKVTLITTQK